MLNRISVDALPSAWPWIAARCDLPDLRGRLEREQAAVYRIDGVDAAVVLTVGLTKDSGVRALWVSSLGGHVGFHPKANTRLMSGVLDEVTAMAKASGCSEVRIEPGERADWKRRLLPLFGFMPMVVGERVIMRKEVS